MNMPTPVAIQYVAERAAAHVCKCFAEALDIPIYCPSCGRRIADGTGHFVDWQPTEVLVYSLCGGCSEKARNGQRLKARSKWLSSAPAALIECTPGVSRAVYEAVEQRLEEAYA